MYITVATFILVVVLFIFIYLSQSKTNKTSSIPFVKCGWLPIIGHLLPFLINRTKFIMKCHERYGNCFKIKLVNQTFIFLSSPLDSTAIMKNSSFYFPKDSFAKRIFDFSDDFFFHSELNKIIHRQFVEHLKNRDGLKPIVTEFIHRLRDVMHRDKTAISNDPHHVAWIKSGLLELSHRILYEPSSVALFGDIDLLSIENDFRIFDDKFHYFTANFPTWFYSIFLKNELKARSNINRSWIKNQNSPHQSSFNQARTTLRTDYSEWISEKDYCSFQTSLFWASLGNTIPTVFWCLFFILNDIKAMEAIKNEIDQFLPYFSLEDRNSDRIIEQWTPDLLNSCVYLESAVNETLRLVASNMMVRKCNEQMQITLHDGRILNIKPEDTVASFVPICHFDSNTFVQPNKFIFDRFLNKNPDTITGYMPFGGGKSMCPGRYFAKVETKICIAMILRYLECQFIDADVMPIQKEYRVGLGIAPPDRHTPIYYRYKL